MLSSESRSQCPQRRARRRTGLAAPEQLESRELLAASPLGFSLPDLTITGSAADRAAWGGTLGINATVINTGTSTITNPIAQAPLSPTTADAPQSLVSVVITPRPHSGHAVVIGSFKAPPVSQNSLEQIDQAFPLPSRPRGFNGPGGKFYVHLVVNSNGSALESNLGNNIGPSSPVKIARLALPELRATALYTPTTLNPGDTIDPQITITNYGTAYSGSPIQVALVASTTPNFTVGSSIVALYSIQDNLPPSSAVPVGGSIGAFSFTTPLDNSFTFTGPAVTLPTSPGKYYLGVVVDPYGLINQLSVPKNPLAVIHTVGPNTSGLPPAGVVSTPNVNPFPLPASGLPIGVTLPATTSSTTGNSTII